MENEDRWLQRASCVLGKATQRSVVTTVLEIIQDYGEAPQSCVFRVSQDS